MSILLICLPGPCSLIVFTWILLTKVFSISLSLRVTLCTLVTWSTCLRWLKKHKMKELECHSLNPSEFRSNEYMSMTLIMAKTIIQSFSLNRDEKWMQSYMTIKYIATRIHSLEKQLSVNRTKIKFCDNNTVFFYAEVNIRYEEGVKCFMSKWCCLFTADLKVSTWVELNKIGMLMLLIPCRCQPSITSDSTGYACLLITGIDWL